MSHMGWSDWGCDSVKDIHYVGALFLQYNS
jgi:hypothetical protein